MDKGLKKGRSALGRGLSALISSPAVPVTSAYGSNVATIGQAVMARMAAESDDSVDLNLRAVPTSPSNTNEANTLTPHQQIQFLALDQIYGNPTQPRQVFDDVEIAELATSIKTYGVLQPVLVRPAKADSSRGGYEIIAGERRWRAAKLAGLATVPVIIQDLSDKETLEISLVENVQRSNLNPVEEAEAYQRLIDEFSLTQQEVADRVGKDRASIANFVRLLKLPPEVMALVKDGRLSMGHAKAILTIKEPAAQLSLAKKAVDESLSVRALEDIVSRVVVLDTGNRGRRVPAKAGNSSEFNPFPEAIDRMRTSLGTKVSIKHSPAGRGRIEIEYFSEAELDRLVEHLCRS